MRMIATVATLLTGAVLLATTACSTDSGTDREKGARSHGAKTAGRAELDRAVLSGTVAGYQVEKLAARDIPLDDAYAVDREECAPVGALIGGHLPVKPSTEVYRTVKPADPKNATVGNIWLSAYDGDDAGRVIDTLNTAVDKCQGSFTTAGMNCHSVERIGSVTPGEAAFRVTGDAGKRRITMNYRVVRAGTVVAGFYGVNLLDPGSGTIPAAVVDAQLERLGKG